jgi:hypothetical protein
VWAVDFVLRGEPPISRERPHESQERRLVFDSLRIRLWIGIHFGVRLSASKDRGSAAAAS